MLLASASQAESASLPANAVRSTAFNAIRSTSACAAAALEQVAACLSFTSRERFSSCRYIQVNSLHCSEKVCLLAQLQHQGGVLLASALQAESASLPADTVRSTAFNARGATHGPAVDLCNSLHGCSKNRESCLPQCCEQHTCLHSTITIL